MNTQLVLTPCPLSQATHLYYESTDTLISLRVISQLREDITYMIGAESVRVEPGLVRVPPRSEADTRPIMSYTQADRIARSDDIIKHYVETFRKINAIKHLRDISVNRGFKPIPLQDAKRIIDTIAAEMNGPQDDAS